MVAEHGLNYGAGAMTSHDLEQKAASACDAAWDFTKAAVEELGAAVTKGAEATDDAIRAKPYQAVGLALVAGLITGVLATRSRRSC